MINEEGTDPAAVGDRAQRNQLPPIASLRPSEETQPGGGPRWIRASQPKRL